MSKDKSTESKNLVDKVEEKVEHKNIYAALSAFQGEVAAVKKTAKVNFSAGKGTVDFNYSPLEEIVNTIRKTMAKHGLSYRHEIKKIENQDYIEAIITHETYEEYQATYKEEADKDISTNTKHLKTRTRNVITSGPIKIDQSKEMKDTGASITYARRYSLTMALGIAAEDDKDVLFTERAEKALNFAYKKALGSIQGAKTLKELEKPMSIVEKDLEMVEKGKSGALGLTKEQYEELILEGESKKQELSK